MRFRITKGIIVIGITAVFIAAVVFTLNLANKNKIARGLEIANISVGGLSFDEASAKANRAIEEFLNTEIILRYKTGNISQIWTASPEELKIQIDASSALAKISQIGHQRKFLSNISEQALALFGYYNLPLNYGINEITLEKFIREELDLIDHPAVNAGWEYNHEKKGFVPIPSQQGLIIDREDFKSKLYQKIKNLNQEDIYLSLIYDVPTILENEIFEAYNKAEKILDSAPYKLTANSPSGDATAEVMLTKKGLIPLIEFRPAPEKNNSQNTILEITFNRQKLGDYLVTLSSSINQEPINAELKVQGNRVVEFAFSQEGQKLEINKNIIKLREKIIEENKKEIELEVSIIPPKISIEDINNRGITSFLAKGVSNFAGSPTNRIHNIKIGAAEFNGVLIKPGEEFSFNAVLGEIGPEQGYKPELTIKKDKTIPEYGGGLCQVSTTAFRMAINAGLPITERTPHAFPVVYYSPQGFDATIYPPHPDLRFINNTSGHFLVQTEIKGYDLIFELYGTNDGRKVEIEGPYQYDTKSDGSMKAKLIRKIYKDDKLIEEEAWYSNYKSPSLYPVQRNPLE